MAEEMHAVFESRAPNRVLQTGAQLASPPAIAQWSSGACARAAAAARMSVC